MRGSEIAAYLFLLSGISIIPVAGSAQQTTPAQVQPEPAPQSSQIQNNSIQPDQTQQQTGQAQPKNNMVEPPHTPQQTDQLHEQEHRNAEDTRIDQNWTAHQQSEERLKQAEERMIIDRIRQRLMEEREDRQRAGQYSAQDENRNFRPNYGSTDRGGDRYYYEARPYARLKTCVEYENGEEFCRYRN